MCISTVSVIAIVHVSDVKRKIDGGYKVVKFNEVNNNADLRGNVIQALVEHNFYSALKLDGGQLSSKRYCKGNSCESKTIAFEFESDQYIPNKLRTEHQYVAMIGNTFCLWFCNCYILHHLRMLLLR